MSAFADILVSSALDATVLTTSATQAADMTYSPVGYIQPGVAKWEARGSGVTVAFPTFTMSVRPPTKGSRLNKVTARLNIPVLEAVSGANIAGLTPAATVAYSNSVNLDVLLHERATAAEKLVLLNHMLSLLFTTINANDGSPTSTTSSPLRPAWLTQERPY